MKTGEMTATVEELLRELTTRKDIQEVVHTHEVPAKGSVHADTERPLPPEITRALEGLGIERLFTHQARSIDVVRRGENLVAMTPTSSGKSLVYNIPVVESILEDPEAKALYLYPLKGLEQDQLGALREFARLAGLEKDAAKVGNNKKGRRPFTPGVCEIYDGDTTGYRRKKIRESPPSVLLTNPDMLHLAICAFHTKWEDFFRNLKYVVIDEVHSYRGVFGSHVAHVLRRLARIASHYGSEPTFIACSATIANPGELTRMLTGEDFKVITESGAPLGRRRFLFLNPPPTVNPYTVANKVFTTAVEKGLRTIAFTKARKITELMHRRVTEAHPELAGTVSSYRAGFLPTERREIEKRLFSGELTGVISTSALELGVDIGGLDVCVLVGYPGTITSTLQRAGRAGRRGRDSLVVLVALQDALDQYFMRNPEDFFRRSVEAAVLDHENDNILSSHLACAASEIFIKADDPVYDSTRYGPVLERLERAGSVRHWKKGDIWYPRRKYPQREVSIRQTGENYLIRDPAGALLGESSSTRVFRELHPGAIYMHRGTQWRVRRLDTRRKEVTCTPAEDASYYTRPISEEETEIVSTDSTRDFGRYTFRLGRLRVTERVLGYRKKNVYTDELLGEYLLELPEQVFTTVGVWTTVDDGLLAGIKEEGYSVAGGLHALEHAAIAALPLFALCDRTDLGGVSYTWNPELESPAIFIYDGVEGGVGLAGRGYGCAPEWLEATRRLMEECPCEVACPGCTQDPQCGNNNEPLDKRSALAILCDWLGNDHET